MIYGNYMRGDVKSMYRNYAHEEKSHLASRWGSKETQEANFTQVASVMKNYKGIKTVLDVGCGLGDIRPFLPSDIRYTGIDITPEIVHRANDPDIHEADITEYNPDTQYDAVIALGTFNMGVPYEKVKEALTRMHELSDIVTIVSISYTSPEDLKDLESDGWSIITNPTAFNDGYGDKHIVIKSKS